MCPSQACTAPSDGLSSSDPENKPTERSAAVVKAALPVRHFVSKLGLSLPPEAISAAGASIFRPAAATAVQQASAASSRTADAMRQDASSASQDTKAAAAVAETDRWAAGSPSHLTLMQVMQQGTYGAFARAVAPLVGEHLLAMPDLELPCIVVMGNLGCGKTALAQQITGCRAFSNVAQACAASCSSEHLMHQPVSVTFWQTDHYCTPTRNTAACSSPAAPPHPEECHQDTWTCCESGRSRCDEDVLGGDRDGNDSRYSRQHKESRDEIRLTCTCPLHFSNEPLAQIWSCPLEVIDLPGMRAFPAAANRYSSAMLYLFAAMRLTPSCCVWQKPAFLISGQLRRWRLLQKMHLSAQSSASPR